ncbi:MAG: hypothetical protein M1829_006210 [Trizodia sp. TS-e1964]|nr:MAG: hypothetical protein M1829_006210 [Trizodia sp. TS-e1964]
MSALEQLPVEILEPLFLGSMNCDLPLVSKRLLAALSNPSLHLDTVITILVSKNTPAQSALLHRRFFSSPLFEKASSRILQNTLALCPSNSQEPDPRFHGARCTSQCSPPVFENDVQICERMLKNPSLFFSWTDRFCAYRIYPMFSAQWLPQTLLDASIRATAQQELHRLVEAEEYSTATDLLTQSPPNATVFEAWLRPRDASVKEAVIAQNCAERGLVHLLFKQWEPQWEGAVDGELAAWCQQGVSRDLLARAGHAHKETLRHNLLRNPHNQKRTPHWIGEWVGQLCCSISLGRPLEHVELYDDFHQQRSGADGG